MPPKRTRRTDIEVAQRLVKARKDAGLSQADVEHLMRNAMPSGGWFSQAKVRRMEHGEAGFTTMELGMLAGLYGVTVASLSPEAGDEWSSIVEMLSAVQSRCLSRNPQREAIAELITT